MAFQNSESAVDVNFNFNYLVVQTTMKMRDAKAARSWWEYWVHFEFAAQLVLSYLEPKVAKDIQLDMDDMDRKINDLTIAYDNGVIAEKTKDMQINLLRADFSDKRRYYVMKALNKIGIVKVAEDGVVDFDSIDLETMSAVIRSGNEELTKEHKPVQQDTTLVIDPVSKKVFRMGTAEYKEYLDSKIFTKQQEVMKEPSPTTSIEELAKQPEPSSQAPEQKEELAPVFPNLPEADEMPTSEFRLRIGYPKEKKETDESDAWEENPDGSPEPEATE
jgi:hypothetical protein